MGGGGFAKEGWGWRISGRVLVMGGVGGCSKILIMRMPAASVEKWLSHAQ